MKRYLQDTLNINRYNLFGIFLLLPAFIVFTMDLLSRILQGDLSHYNRPVFRFLSHTPLYCEPVLFIWVIVFPFLAIIVNLIPFFKNLCKKHANIKSLSFIKQNFLTAIILLFAILFILLIRFHDFVPCMVHSILKIGFFQLFNVISVCEKA